LVEIDAKYRIFQRNDDELEDISRDSIFQKIAYLSH